MTFSGDPILIGALLVLCSLVAARARAPGGCGRRTSGAAGPAGVSAMTKEMIISSTPHETRVAILEEDQVVEIFIEREHSRGVVGNIYKGRVSKVLAGHAVGVC